MTSFNQEMQKACIPVLLVLAVIAPACGDLADKERPVVQVHYTQAGELVVAADRVLKVFDGTLSKERLSMGHGPNYATQEEWATGVSGDGRLAAVALNSSVVIFDLQNGKKVQSLNVQQLKVHSELPGLELHSLALSPDGQHLAVLTREFTPSPVEPASFRQVYHVVVFRAATGARVWQLPGDSDGTTSNHWSAVLFSPDSRHLWARRALDTEYGVFAVQDGASQGTFTLAGAGFNKLYPSSDRTRVLGAIENGPQDSMVPAVWNAHDGALQMSFPTVAERFCGRSPLWMDASANQNLFAGALWTKCMDGTAMDLQVVVWNPQGEVLYRFPAPAFFSLSFSPDSGSLAVAEGIDGVSVYRMSDGARIGHRKFEERIF